MAKNTVCIRVLLWIGMALFLLCFLGSTIAPESVLPAIGLSEYNDFIIRLYGIFQLSWVLLFYSALKDVEKNLAIINGAIITGTVVAVFFVVYQLATRKHGGYLLANAAFLLVYSGLLFICKPKPARPKEKTSLC